jgi:hypothetical protein
MVLAKHDSPDSCNRWSLSPSIDDDPEVGNLLTRSGTSDVVNTHFDAMAVRR